MNFSNKNFNVRLGLKMHTLCNISVRNLQSNLKGYVSFNYDLSFSEQFGGLHISEAGP